MVEKSNTSNKNLIKLFCISEELRLGINIHQVYCQNNNFLFWFYSKFLNIIEL